jgi:hypothetical protein
MIRQAPGVAGYRRMEAATLSERYPKDVGRARVALEETVREMAASFRIEPGELNLDLGPLGRLL